MPNKLHKVAHNDMAPKTFQQKHDFVEYSEEMRDIMG